ncbi:MAG: hypothetical protein JWN38_832 [Candidatus Saccharibacteria bacterium]|nr:hypothetical protein [Candidatus Saccharibacteria bacterium]
MKQPMNLSKQAITELTGRDPQGMAVTIYIPTHFESTPAAMTENQIRSKNLIGAALDMLQDMGEGQGAQQLLRQQMDGMADLSFWKSSARGLLICADNANLEVFHLPVDTEEYVAVTDSYHLAPIFGILQDAQEYYVLSLAQHNPMLWKGSMYGIAPAKISLPASIEAGLNLDETNQKSEQQRSAGGTNNFNGRGGAKSPVEDDRVQFWRMIDHLLCQKADTLLPLILAGTEKDLSEFRAHSKYPKILKSMAHGNFTSSTSQELFTHATQIITSELTDAMHDRAALAYESLEGAQPQLAARYIEDIQTAAETGRVDSLLIRMTRRTADTVRDSAEQVTMLSFEASQKLNQALQRAALAVWKTGGQIINIDEARMPRHDTLAVATLRY